MFKGLLLPSIGTAYGVHEAASFSVLTGKRHAQFIRRLDGLPPSSSLFDIARINKIITSGGGRKLLIADNPDIKPPLHMDSGHLVRLIDEKPGSIEAEATGPGRLIFSQAYFSGWTVFIDQQRGKREIFEEAFISTTLNPGRHRVRFIYRPFSFLAGVGLSLLTLMGLLIFLIFRPSFKPHPIREKL